MDLLLIGNSYELILSLILNFAMLISNGNGAREMLIFLIIKQIIIWLKVNSYNFEIKFHILYEGTRNICRSLAWVVCFGSE